MSFQAMNWAINQKLPTKEKFVLLMLANYSSNETGDCYPSLTRLQEDTSMSRDSVIRAIKSLESTGILSIIRRYQDGVNLPNIYRLNLQGVVAHSGGGSRSQHGGVVAHSDSNLSCEPISEQSALSLPTADIPTDVDFDKNKINKPAIIFKNFLSNCKKDGINPIPENDTVFDWAKTAGVPIDFLHIAWIEFKYRYSESSKRYRDWRQVFRNAVRDNWFKIWYCNENGVVCLSNQGRLIQKTHAESE